MTKKEYIDFVRNSLPMVDKTAKFHPQQVAGAINMAVNAVFYDMYNSGDKKIRKSLERYTTQTQLTCSQDLNTNRYRSTLTVDVVDLPRKTGGVYEVLSNAGASTNTTTLYVPVTTMEGEQFYGAEASLPGNVVGFSWSLPRQIEYWDMSGAEATTGVTVRLIQQFKSYALTDNVLLPYGKESVIIDKVREYLGLTPPKDLVNNNADSNG